MKNLRRAKFELDVAEAQLLVLVHLMLVAKIMEPFIPAFYNMCIWIAFGMMGIVCWGRKVLRRE